MPSAMVSIRLILVFVDPLHVSSASSLFGCYRC
jgi:hypothetical protein